MPSMEYSEPLHIVMLPWLAMGHLIPFLELAKRLASKGHLVSFLTTPLNIDRIRARVPPRLATLITFVEISLHHDVALPDDVQATVDLSSEDLRNKLHDAFDTAHGPELSSFLRRRSPAPADWVIYDYTANRAPSIAKEHGASSVFLSLFSAATLTFFGPMGGEVKKSRTTLEHFTVAPEWVPFPTTVAFRLHEIKALFQSGMSGGASRNAGSAGFATAVCDSPFVAIRSCYEFEGEWLKVLGELYGKPVIPIGLLPPILESEENGKDDGGNVCRWLDGQETGTVVYAAFGSEANLTGTQVAEIATGLELSGLPFVWALRSGAELLPEGFEERTEERGLVVKGWAPQPKILAHPAVGGFLTHGGWNSVVEGLASGTAMIVLPMLFDQGLNARELQEKGVGLEVVRDEEDGKFTGEEIAKKLRLAMVDEEGEGMRVKVREYSEKVFGEEVNDGHVDEFVKYLREQKKSTAADLSEAAVAAE